MLRHAFIVVCVTFLWLNVESWILRLSCKDEADFSVRNEGYVLENYVIGRFTSAHAGECVQECIKNSACKSINFKENGVNNCEINSSIKEAENAINYKQKTGWTYFSTLYNTTKVGSFCEAFAPCRSKELCIDTCDCPFYRCLRCPKCQGIKYELSCETKTTNTGTNNIALNKPSTSSSFYTHRTVPNIAGLANDGDRSNHHLRCAITKRDRNPWWKVDLGASALVSRVAVISRIDYHNRINPFDIRVGDSSENGGVSNPYCAEGATLAPGQMKTFECVKDTCGRYVSINLKKQEYLQVCEVEVYGIY